MNPNIGDVAVGAYKTQHTGCKVGCWWEVGWLSVFQGPRLLPAPASGSRSHYIYRADISPDALVPRPMVVCPVDGGGDGGSDGGGGGLDEPLPGNW